MVGNRFPFLFKIVEKTSNRIVDLKWYQNHYDLIKKSHVFSGVQVSKKIMWTVFEYSSQKVLIKRKQSCEQQGITAIKTSIESQSYWKE